MKNIGSFLAFNEVWFAKNQRFLLRLLNNKWTKRWFRWILRIREADCSLKTQITEIWPNRFSYGNKLVLVKDEWQMLRTTDFRTHPKYGKRIYYAFRPIWWLIHFWDWLIADRFIPQWSYGFLTLTVYPDAGDPGTTSVDGRIARDGVDELYATIRAGAGVTVTSGTNAFLGALLTTSATTNFFALLSRSWMLFDTSALTASATISAAVLSIWGNLKSNVLGSPDLHIAGGTTVSNTTLGTADFANRGTTSFGSVTYADFDETGTIYTDITLNASGISNVSLTDVSKFTGQQSWDILNDTTGLTWVSGNSSNFRFSSADVVGTANDPKLVVTYTVPATNNNLSLLRTG